MKKTNFISKTIILLLFSTILVCSVPLKKEKALKGRLHEINLRNLELTKDNFGFFIFYSLCYTSILFIGLVELCILCQHKCDCNYEEKLPNKCIFLYFSLCGCLIVMTVVLIILNEWILILGAFLHLIAFVIGSLIYLVKCLQNKKKYCTDICTMEYLSELASYPCPYYCACCFTPCPTEFCPLAWKLFILILYVVGSAIEYYLFLLFYMLLMLLTKIFSSCRCCKSGCKCICCDCSCCCECCHCCKCCLKKKKQTIPTDEQNNEQNDVCVTTLKAEAVYYESFVTNESEIDKNNNENNNEIEEVKAYENENGNNNENYKEISEGNVYENEKGNDNENNNENYKKISEGNVYENEKGNDNENYKEISKGNIYENENGNVIGNNNNV